VGAVNGVWVVHLNDVHVLASIFRRFTRHDTAKGIVYLKQGGLKYEVQHFRRS